MTDSARDGLTLLGLANGFGAAADSIAVSFLGRPLFLGALDAGTGVGFG